MKQIIVDYAHVGVELLDLCVCIGVNLTLIEHVLQMHDQNVRRKSLCATSLLLHHHYMISRRNGDANNNNQNNSFLPLLFNKNNPSIKALVHACVNRLEELEPSLVQQSLIIKDSKCIMKVIDNLQHHSITNYLMEGSLGNNLFYANSRSNSVDDYYCPNHLYVRCFAKLRNRLENGSYCSNHGRGMAAVHESYDSYQNSIAQDNDKDVTACEESSDPAETLANDKCPFALYLNLMATIQQVCDMCQP